MSQSNSKLIVTVLLAGLPMIALAGFLGFKAGETKTGSGNSETLSLNETIDSNAIDDSSANGSENAGKHTLYAWATDRARIDSNPAYLEKQLGPAESKFSPYTNKIESLWTFNIEGCQVQYGIAGTSVKYVDATVTDTCTPVMGDLKITPSTTIKKVYNELGKGLFRANCLGLGCGNAIEPSTDLWIAGAHVGGFIDMAFVLRDADEADTETWAEKIAASHMQSVESFDAIQTCSVEPPREVQRAFMASKISNVMLGRDIPIGPFDCDEN